MTDEQLADAYFWWTQFYLHMDTDDAVVPHLKTNARTDWIHTARRALHLSMSTVSARMDISRQAFAQLESNEADGHVTLRNLKRIAEAMNCEMVYCLRPKAKEKFSQVIWRQLVAYFAKEKLVPDFLHEKRRPRAWACGVGERMHRAKVRTALGWSKRLR